MDETLAMRARPIKDVPVGKGPVVYWMHRDHRLDDNWSLIYSMEKAKELDQPLCVAFCLAPEFLGATLRQFRFLVGGLNQLPEKFEKLGIGYALLEGYPETVLSPFLHDVNAGLVVTDFDPLHVKARWNRRLAGCIDIPLHEVDAHNVVPCWLTGQRRISTYPTFRKSIGPLLPRFFIDFPPIAAMDRVWNLGPEGIDWHAAMDRVKVDVSVKPVTWALPGEDEAKKALKMFITDRLEGYQEKAMIPVARSQSDLSPYLHFGQISAQRVALEVRSSKAPEEAKANFLDQIIVKRELSDNFILHTPDYDTFGAFAGWAKDSLNAHRLDAREHVYTKEQFEMGLTHDPLWNAAQTELVKIGKIHGSLREYWAGKILEWTKNPEEGLATAIYLNDRYGLDARDPSGYTGILMVMGGLYGKPWAPKEVLGKVKRLTYTAERLNYDIHEYMDRVKAL
ncbi:MAG TPA: deoxyribodipyrimidine photo-lyase [Methanomassiliicoccales archaeon]|nr:deoxyribodipyrimidine photo-lyase [Methanomassiliicoccales archaeon]